MNMIKMMAEYQPDIIDAAAKAAAEEFDRDVQNLVGCAVHAARRKMPGLTAEWLAYRGCNAHGNSSNSMSCNNQRSLVIAYIQASPAGLDEGLLPYYTALVERLGPWTDFAVRCK